MAADVSSNLASWSENEGSNSPSGSTSISTNLDDNLRQIQATTRKYLATKGTDIASSGTTDLSTATGLIVDITGTTTITGFGTLSAGMWKILQFDDVVMVKYNASSMVTPGKADLVTAAGDHMVAYSMGSGNWIIPFFSAVRDSAFALYGSADITKKHVWDVDTNVATGTTITTKTPGASGTVAIGADPLGLFLPRSYLTGFALTYQTTTSFDIAAGQCRDSTNASNITLSSSITGCALTASTAWAAGNSANKLNNQTIPAAGTLHVFAMRKDSDGTGEVLIDASLTPTLPSGYTYYRRVASLRTSSSVWIQWNQFGDMFQWQSLQNDGSAFNSGLGTTAANFAVTVPSGIKVIALVQVHVSIGTNAAGVRVYDPGLADVSPSTSDALNTALALAVGSTNTRIGAEAQVPTNTSAQIRAISTAALGNADLRTRGWIDRRGRDD